MHVEFFNFCILLSYIGQIASRALYLEIRSRYLKNKHLRMSKYWTSWVFWVRLQFCMFVTKSCFYLESKKKKSKIDSIVDTWYIQRKLRTTSLAFGLFTLQQVIFFLTPHNVETSNTKLHFLGLIWLSIFVFPFVFDWTSGAEDWLNYSPIHGTSSSWFCARPHLFFLFTTICSCITCYVLNIMHFPFNTK